jgi:hypothetical protein
MQTTDVKKPLAAVVRLCFRDANLGRVFFRDGWIMHGESGVGKNFLQGSARPMKSLPARNTMSQW